MSYLPLVLFLVACDADPVREAPSAPEPEPATQAAPALEPVRALLDHEVLLTAGATEDQPLPLLVAVHGLGDRPERFQRLFEGLSVPARVVLPRAPTPTQSGGGSWFAFRRNDADREAFGRRVHEAADGVVALVDWAEEHYPTTGEPVITGFSQGGMVSFAVAAGWPDEVAAAVPVGGDLALSLVPSASEAPPSVLAFHGDADQVVPIGPVVAAVQALQDAGYATTLRRYDGVGHGLNDAMRSDYHQALAALLQEQAGGLAQP